MVVLTAAEGVGRALSFVFYIFAARSLAPVGFGVLRYTITIATVAFGALQVLSTVTSREVGAARADPKQLGEVVSTAFTVAVAGWAITSLLCVIVHLTGVLGTTDLIGLISVLSGYAVFQIYYAVARGIGDLRRATLSYVGGSVVQLMAFAVLVLVAHPGHTIALVIFGASSFVPILAYELLSPIATPRRLRPRWRAGLKLWRLARPLLLAQVAVVVWGATDQIWVERRFGAVAIGIYGAAVTLAQLFLILAFGVNGVLLPRSAELQAAGATRHLRRLTIGAVTGVFVVSLSGVILVSLFRGPLLTYIYGASFIGAGQALVGQSVALAIYAGFITLTTALVGIGRPKFFLIGMGVTALSQIALLLRSTGGVEWAAWSHATSVGIGLLTVFALLLLVRTPSAPVQRP